MIELPKLMQITDKYFQNIKQYSELELRQKVQKSPYSQALRSALAYVSQDTSEMGHAAIYGTKWINLSRAFTSKKEMYNDDTLLSKTIASNETDISESSALIEEEGLPDWAEDEINQTDIDQIAQHTPNENIVSVAYYAKALEKEQRLNQEMNPHKIMDSKDLKSEVNLDEKGKLDQDISEKNHDKKKKKKKKKTNKWLISNDLSDFILWLIDQKPLEKSKLERLQRKSKKRKKSLVELIAEKSITKSEHIVSESLAKLLANQGHTNEAIEMYHQLSLLFPEKSTYFASQIENLKNN